MVTLKHKPDVRVKSVFINQPQLVVQSQQSRPHIKVLRPNRQVVVRHSQGHVRVQKVVAPVSPNKVRSLVASRTTRQIPNTKARISRTVPPPPVRTVPSEAAINGIKNIGTSKVLVIVGNGPTHHQAPLDKLLEHSDKIDMMSINRPDERLWPTKYWVFCDSSQFRRHKHLWNQYGGMLINSSAIKEAKNGSIKIKSLHGKGFSFNLIKGMYIGRSSVYAAIQIGLWMGYEHIYVFGCDMASVGGKVYPWGSNPDVADGTRVKRFKFEAENYNWMAQHLGPDIRRKITFCSTHNPWEFIKSFENLDHIDAVDLIMERHVGETKIELGDNHGQEKCQEHRDETDQ